MDLRQFEKKKQALQFHFFLQGSDFSLYELREHTLSDTHRYVSFSGKTVFSGHACQHIYTRTFRICMLQFLRVLSSFECVQSLREKKKKTREKYFAKIYEGRVRFSRLYTPAADLQIAQISRNAPHTFVYFLINKKREEGKLKEFRQRTQM